MLTSSLPDRGALNFSGMAQDAKHPAKLMLRKWLSANGVPSSYAARLSFADLERAYNDTTDATLRSLRIVPAVAPVAPVASTVTIDEDAFMNAVAPTAAVVAAPVVADNANPLAPLLAYLQAQIGNSVNEDKVRAIVAEAIANVPAKKIDVTSNTGTVTLEERTNPVFARVLHHVARGENVLLVGPAGCGKTHLGEQVARALNRRFGMISGSAGASESQLMGWLLPSDGGKFEYQPSEFVELYEGGSAVFVFDEFDAFDGNMVLCANSALANGHFTVPQRRGNTRVNRGKDFGIIANANTFGTGADPIYAGRNQMDGASLNRFTVIEMTYDRALERDIASSEGMLDGELEEFWALRSKVAECGLLRVISTRDLKKVTSNMAFGMSFRKALADLLTGWSADEKQRVGF